MHARIAVVTGANRGIGFEIARQLAASGLRVLAASRTELGPAAARELGAEPFRLDVTSEADHERLADELATGFDVLVNNAGVALDGFDVDVVQRTLAVNVLGPVRLTDRLLAALRPGGRVVNVSSGMGELSSFAPSLRAKFSAPDLNRPALLALLADFERGVATGRNTAQGWPSSAYRVSKAALNAYTRILARDLAGNPRRILVNAACPGWVRTRMGGAGAPRTPEHGARTPVWLALLPNDGPTGGFFRDEQSIPF